MAQGVLIFSSLADAIRLGYQIYDKTKDGYLLRTKNSDGLWAMALCQIKP